MIGAGCAVDGEVRGEAFGVDRGGGDDDLEVGAARQELPEVAEDEVDVQAALVGLVDDQRVVPVQVAVAGDLGEQDAVGHELDQGVVAGLVGEPDLVADGGAELGAGLLGDALGDGAGGDAAGLGVADLAGDAAAELEADLGQLGGLARPGLAGHDHDLVVPDRLGDVVPALADRQFCGVADVGDRFAAPGYPAGRPLDLGGQLGDGLVAGGLVAEAVRAVDTPGQPVLVVQHQLGQGAAQVGERRQRGRLSHRRQRVEEEDPVVPTLLGMPGFPLRAGYLISCSAEPFEDMVADPDRIGHRGQGGVHRAKSLAPATTWVGEIFFNAPRRSADPPRACASRGRKGPGTRRAQLKVAYLARTYPARLEGPVPVAEG